MLSIHGLVIVAEAPSVALPTKYGHVIKLEVASEAGYGGTTYRYLMDIFVTNAQKDELLSKLTPGVVCEIVHGRISEFFQPSYSQKEGIKYSKNTLQVESKNLKILKIPLYYTDLPGITEETKGNPSD